MAASSAGSSTLITVAPTGAEADKAAVPALPVTLAELVVTAKECEAAGAAVIHVHIRDDEARPTLEVSRLADTVAALPDGATWSATGIGRTTLPVMLGALGAGGHLRVGMEDTLTFSRGRPVARNAELVERAADLARLAQRPPIPPAEARAFLSIPTGPI